jgi:hypothetical protein
MYKKVHLFIVAVAASIFILGLMGWAITTRASTASTDGPFGTAFTYQGFLTVGGIPADGEFDFTFDLYPGESDPPPPIDSEILENVPVAQGVFTVWLNFGPGSFDGDECWLEISVRPGAESGPYTSLGGRQALTPAPYALFSVEAGAVEWDAIQNRPPGLDDGDDNTIYSAGYGLDLDGNIFNVMTDTIQARVNGDCMVGSMIQSIKTDGSVDCEAHDTRLVFNQIGLDSVDDVGEYSSIIIGSDGLPVISYHDSTNGALKVVHCDDLACQSSRKATLDDSEDVGL